MNTVIAKKVENFFSSYKSQTYSQGKILIFSGESSDYVYQILEGRVKHYDITEKGDEVILNVFKPPAFFPMSMALNGGESDYIYEAETAATVRKVPSKDVIEFLHQNPDVTLNLLSRVYRGVDGVLGRMVQLMSGSAQSRLIYELILHARRFGKSQQGKECVVEISEKELGAHAGLSRETVSREISKLKADGLIAVKRNGIEITQISKLEDKLGHVI